MAAKSTASRAPLSLGDLAQKLGKDAVRTLNNWLPWRPYQSPKARLSWRARFKGHARNVKLHDWATVSEDVMIHVHDAGSTIEVGSGTVLMPFAKLVVAGGGFIRIGKKCTIHSFDVLYGFSGGLVIEDDVRIGVNTLFISGNHRTDDPELGPNEQGSSSEGIVIGAGSWIGAGAIILDGVHLAPKSVVGAGAVVTKSYAERAMLVGVPARPIKRSEEP
jgi:acetyltransferase-like isoleucine patch superfamily enzyme